MQADPVGEVTGWGFVLLLLFGAGCVFCGKSRPRSEKRTFWSKQLFGAALIVYLVTIIVYPVYHAAGPVTTRAQKHKQNAEQDSTK